MLTITTLIFFFQIDCLFPLYLFSFRGFYLSHSHADSLCLLILCNLLYWVSPFFRLQAHHLSHLRCLPTECGAGPVHCVGFLVRGAGACVLVHGARFPPLMGTAVPCDVLWGPCELNISLGSLYANG